VPHIIGGYFSLRDFIQNGVRVTPPDFDARQVVTLKLGFAGQRFGPSSTLRTSEVPACVAQ
jgi:hypothetical protein